MTGNGFYGNAKDMAGRLLASRWMGLPLLYLGVALLLAHRVFSLHSNALLVVAIVLEVAGAVLHFRRIKTGR